MNRFFLRSLFAPALLLASSTLVAHTPVCRCDLKGQEIQCQGAYHDGSSATDTTMTVFDDAGNILAAGKLDKQSRFHFPLPSQPFYVLMDVGPGEMVEIEWKDIRGLAKTHFTTP